MNIFDLFGFQIQLPPDNRSEEQKELDNAKWERARKQGPRRQILSKERVEGYWVYLLDCGHQIRRTRPNLIQPCCKQCMERGDE